MREFTVEDAIRLYAALYDSHGRERPHIILCKALGVNHQQFAPLLEERKIKVTDEIRTKQIETLIRYIKQCVAFLNSPKVQAIINYCENARVVSDTEMDCNSPTTFIMSELCNKCILKRARFVRIKIEN